MGRRFLILTGLMLLLTTPLASAQDSKANAGSDAAVPPPSSPAEPTGELAEPAALPRPEDLPPPESLPGAVANPAGKAAATKAAPAKLDAEVIPAQQAPAETTGNDSPAISAPAAAQAPAPAATPPPAPAQGEASGDTIANLDRLPLGKQEVVLSVEVQSPAIMNYNREATVKIVVRNSGSTDAMGVVVRDELPPGLTCVSSQPEALRVGETALSWNIGTLPATSDRVIVLKVKPTKSTGSMDHGATVTFQAGSKSSSRVQRPRLKLEVIQVPADGKVLKGKSTEFRLSVTNAGDGPARNVLVQAKLSSGLRHDTGEHNEDNSFELPIQMLDVGQREDLDPLILDAVQGGPQWCKISVTSPDVDFEKEVAEVTRTLEVVEPKLKMTLVGPESCITDAVAKYSVTLENTGTAPARNVKILATLGVSGRLINSTPAGKYDSASRRILWTIPQIDPGEKPRVHDFEIRMGGINSGYEVNVQIVGDGGLALRDRRLTDVKGVADVVLDVRERKRIVESDGTTSFTIRLRNYGTKEATRVLVEAKLSSNLSVEATGGGPNEQAMASPGLDAVTFPIIPRLGPGKEVELFIKVRVTKKDRGLGTCRVFVLHDDLPETDKIEDLAGVKISESRRTDSTTR